MKRSIFLLTLIACFGTSFAIAQDEETEKTETKRIAFFDMDNCEICNCMSDVKDMMQKVKWETQIIPNGFLAITVVPEDLKASMEKAKKKMKAAITKLEDGDEMTICGYCQGLGDLIAEGADLTELSTVGGDIMMVTSSDEDVVKKIQAHAKKTIAEHKKMMEQMMKEQAKSGRKG